MATTAQQAAIDWINNQKSGLGGVDAYRTKQATRLSLAQSNNDDTTLKALAADEQRTGLSYSPTNRPVIQADGTSLDKSVSEVRQTLDAPETKVSVASTGIQSQDSGIDNAQHYIDRLNEARKKVALAGLEKSKNVALSNLSQEKTTIQPKYYNAKNQVAAGAQQVSRNFAEYMAARGGSSAGANAQATIMNNVSTQGGLNSLGQQETQAYTDIERRTTDVNNAYESDKVSAEAGIEADRMKLLLDDFYNAQQRGDTQAQLKIANAMAEAGITGSYNSQRTMAGQQLDLNKTIDQRNFDYGVGRDAVLDNRFNQQLERSNFESDRSFQLAKSGQEWSQLFQQGQFDFNKAQTIWDNNFKDKSFQQSMNEAAAGRGLQWANLSQRDKEFVADQAFKERSFTADQEQRGIDNKFRTDQLGNKPPSGSFNLDDYKGFINQNFYKDVPVNPSNPYDKSVTKQLDKESTYKYVISLHLPDDKTDEMLKMYQIPTK
jgi:hypothetical protein